MTSPPLQLVEPSVRQDIATDAQLLQSLCPSVTAEAWSRSLRTFGGLRGLVTTPNTALKRELPAEAIDALRAAFKLNERFSAARDERPHLQTPHEIYAHVRPYLENQPMERFIVMAFNARNRLLHLEVVSEGAVDQCSVDPRKTFAPAVALHATGVVLCHNHPSGDASASVTDIALTKQLREAGRVLCIRLLDHIVVGHNSYVSMLAQGLIRDTTW